MYSPVAVFTLPNMPAYARLFRDTACSFTLPEVNCLLEIAAQFTLPDPTHRGGLFCSAVWGAWVEVWLRCLYNRDNAATLTVLTGETGKSTSCWPCERRWCSRIKQRLWKMVDLRERRRGTVLTRLFFVKNKWSANKEYAAIFALVVHCVCSLHSDVNAFLHAGVFNLQIILKTSSLHV